MTCFCYGILKNSHSNAVNLWSRVWMRNITVSYTHLTGRNSAQTGRRSAGGSIYPGDIEKEFERFFSKGVQSEKKENSSQQKINPMDVTDLFERYMGFKR